MRRVLFLSLAAGGLFLGLAGIGLAGRHRATDEAAAILEKAIKAHGGEEKLAAIKAVKTKSQGSSVQPGDRPVDFTRETSYLLPDKFKQDTSMAGVPRTILLFNKGKGSLSTRAAGGAAVNAVITLENGRKVNALLNPAQQSFNADLKGNQLTELKEQLHRKQVGQLVCLKGKAYTLSPLGEIKVADKPAVGIHVKAKGFRDIDLFFDKKTGLLVKTRYRLKDEKSGKEFAEEQIVTEYQRIDGVSVPKKITVHGDGNKVSEEEEFVETKLLKTLDEKAFAKP